MRRSILFAAIAVSGACSEAETLPLPGGNRIVLAFDSLPGDFVAGRPAGSVKVSAHDREGNLDLAPLAIQLGAMLSDSSAIEMLSTGSTGGGRVEFAEVTIARTGSFRLIAQATGADSAISDAFVVARDERRLEFRTQPTDTVVGRSISPSVEVVALGHSDAPISVREGITVTMLRMGRPTGPAVTRNAIDGSAEFDDLQPAVAGEGFVLVASARDFDDVTSAPFDVLATGPEQLVWSPAPPLVVYRNQPIDFGVELRNQDGTRNENLLLEVSITLIEGTGALSGTVAGSLSHGTVSFAPTYSVAEVIRIQASAPGLTPIVSDAIRVRASIERVFGPGGVESRGGSTPSLSGDGRVLSAYFYGADHDSSIDVGIYVLDRSTGDLRKLSVDEGGKLHNNYSYYSVVSTDGRFVAFDDNLGYRAPNQVFLHDVEGAQSIVVSVDETGTSFGGGFMARGALSDDGELTLFKHGQLYLYRRSTGVSAPLGAIASLDDASIAGGGGFVFYTEAAEIGATRDVFVLEVATGLVERISVSRAGSGGDGHSSDARASSDGRYVVFSSQATNLVDGDTNGVFDVFLRDRLTAETKRINLSPDGGEASGIGFFRSFANGISGDGRFVVYTSDADNLVSLDMNEASDVFVYDRITDQTERVSVAFDGAEANGSSSEAAISADGRIIAFTSVASNLVPDDPNSAAGDIFIVENPLAP